MLRIVLLSISSFCWLSAIGGDVKFYLDSDSIPDSMEVIDNREVCFRLSSLDHPICKHLDDESYELGSKVYVQYKAPQIVAIYEYCCDVNVVPYVTYYTYNEQQKDLIEFAYVSGVSTREMIDSDLSINTSTIEIDYSSTDAEDKVTRIAEHLEAVIERNKKGEVVGLIALDQFDLLMILKEQPIVRSNVSKYLDIADYLMKARKFIGAMLIVDSVLSFDPTLYQAKLLKANVYYDNQQKDLALPVYQEYIQIMNDAGMSNSIPDYVYSRIPD
ncbi:hypothetical protein [Reichenbachiella versicolor]|uniref:hypothetical protein n=1 Tax=Reichenbachiella versicolor TaxID=1821036 RepID=UPI000D6DD7B0|nr:hypothetical protein [Reichenbachiella versicolor]